MFHGLLGTAEKGRVREVGIDRGGGGGGVGGRWGRWWELRPLNLLTAKDRVRLA